MFLFYLLPFFLTTSTLALNFDWERIQLSRAETLNNTSIRFGTPGPKSPSQFQECRAIPGDDQWPSEEDWAKFNETLGGVLLKPKPLAAPCYSGPDYNEKICKQLQTGWGNTIIQ